MQQSATAQTKVHSELLLWSVLNSCSCLCSFMPELLQSFPVHLSSASFKHTTKSLKQCCLPCPESSQNWPYFSSTCFSPLTAHWFTNTVQTCFSELQMSQLDHSCRLDWTPVSLHNLPAMLFFWYFHSLSSLCAHALTYAVLSGAVSHAKLD